MSDPTFYNAVDKRGWINQPQTTRWRSRYRGPRESYKVNSEIQAMIYDVRKIYEKLAGLQDEFDFNVDAIVGGSDDIAASYIWSGDMADAATLGVPNPYDFDDFPLMYQSVALWDVRRYSESGNLLNLGTGGSALDLTFPGGTNDPLFLSYVGEQYAYLPGITDNYLSTPDSVPVSVTGDIDICVRVALDDWTPSAENALVGKYAGVAARSYMMFVRTNGTLRLQWTADGTSAVTATSTAAPTVSDGQALWVRVTLDVDDGAGNRVVKFYTAADSSSVPTSWTQLGSTVTAAGTTSIYDSAQVLEVGSWNTGTQYPLAGKVYRAIVKSGIDGTAVADCNIADASEPAATHVSATTGETWTWNRASSGRKLTLVDRPLFLFGTDDYLSCADNDLLDFAATDSFTVVAAVRLHAPSTQGVLMAKRSSIASAAGTTGWLLKYGATSAIPSIVVDDGTNSSANANPSGPTLGVVTVHTGIRKVDTGIWTVLNTTADSADADTTTLTLANSDEFRIGRLTGAGTSYADMEFLGAMIFNFALNNTQVADVYDYFTTPFIGYGLGDGPLGGLEERNFELLGIQDLQIRLEKLRSRVRAMEGYV